MAHPLTMSTPVGGSPCGDMARLGCAGDIHPAHARNTIRGTVGKIANLFGKIPAQKVPNSHSLRFTVWYRRRVLANQEDTKPMKTYRFENGKVIVDESIFKPIIKKKSLALEGLLLLIEPKDQTEQSQEVNNEQN